MKIAIKNLFIDLINFFLLKKEYIYTKFDDTVLTPDQISKAVEWADKQKKGNPKKEIFRVSPPMKDIKDKPFKWKSENWRWFIGYMQEDVINTTI